MLDLDGAECEGMEEIVSSQSSALSQIPKRRSVEVENEMYVHAEEEGCTVT